MYPASPSSDAHIKAALKQRERLTVDLRIALPFPFTDNKLYELRSFEFLLPDARFCVQLHDLRPLVENEDVPLDEAGGLWRDFSYKEMRAGNMATNVTNSDSVKSEQLERDFGDVVEPGRYASTQTHE